MRPPSIGIARNTSNCARRHLALHLLLRASSAVSVTRSGGQCMRMLRSVTLFSALGAVALVASACDRADVPEGPEVIGPVTHIFPDEQLACFRLTGGGRIDKPE